MLKKLLLSAAFALSTLASATQIDLALELIITHEENKQTGTGSVTINENEVTSIVFNGLENLIIDIVAQVAEDKTVVMQARFFQKVENEELLPIIDWLAVQVPHDEPATFTINESEGNGTLVLVVTPSIVD